MNSTPDKEAFRRTKAELQRIACSLETNSWPSDALYLSMAASPEAEKVRQTVKAMITDGGANRDAERVLRRTLNRLRQHSARLVESI